ncbi:hypothetical protein TNCV_4289781 [Trichonephila clavipes]|nr:hypothetical protein TNCV_4289781 [Trichonephila clavipes]
MQSDRGPRNSSWQGSRCTLSLEQHAGDSTNLLAEIPEGTIDGDETDLHLHNLGMKLKGGYLPFPSTSDSSHKTFGPTDLASTYSVCTWNIFVSIGH